MKILLLAPYPPFPPRSGGALRVFHLARGLAMHHDLTLLTFAPNADAAAALAPLRERYSVVTVHGPPPRSMLRRAVTTLAAPLPDMALRNRSQPYAEALSRLLAAEHYDVVQAESIEMAHYALMARDLTQRIVLDQFNAEYLLQRRAALADLKGGLALPPGRLVAGIYSLVQWRKLSRYERRLLRAFDHILVVSEQDRAALQRLVAAAASKLAVVPNGVDTARIRPGAVRGDLGASTMVFVGALDYRPNLDALRWFTAEVLPLLRQKRRGVRLLVVGRAPGRVVQTLASDEVELIGEVPSVAPYIDGAAVFVVPMRIGGGSRLKLLEALAMEAPVVATSMAVEGIAGVRNGKHLLIADRPEAFADAVFRLMQDPELGRTLGAAGRSHVVDHYDWDASIASLNQLYQQVSEPVANERKRR
ncbi:glycosyltransferase [Candidatus Chloroploca sp. Khr17]|uniref:glycosyltransferase n=1 Tax=Candidatus Chloroploca sp. Khr17 TaxID=2496869 RepID=UPI00101CB6C2|nr:glycosyltransferase [Candidatus Chloroploca sp. Khr17]